MTIRQLRDLLAMMNPDGEAFVTLFHADGSAETFAIEEVTATHARRTSKSLTRSPPPDEAACGPAGHQGSCAIRHIHRSVEGASARVAGGVDRPHRVPYVGAGGACAVVPQQLAGATVPNNRDRRAAHGAPRMGYAVKNEADHVRDGRVYRAGTPGAVCSRVGTRCDDGTIRVPHAGRWVTLQGQRGGGYASAGHADPCALARLSV